MITVTKSNCIGCNQCIKVCPFTVLQEVNGYPEINQNKTCLKCLHCVAICPQDALTYDCGCNDSSIEPSKCCQSVPSHELHLSADFDKQLAHHIKTRRSIRSYQETAVDKDLIIEVLKTIKMAPSAKNQHPCKWIVVHDKENTNKIMEMVLRWVAETGVSTEILSEYAVGNNCVTMDAPNLLIAYGRESAVNPSGDCTIALTSAELLLQAKGVGTCWAGYLNRISNASSEIKEYLGLPKGNNIYGILTMGYADNEEYSKIPYRADPDITWI